MYCNSSNDVLIAGVSRSSDATSQETARVGQMRTASLEKVKALLGMTCPDKDTDTERDAGVDEDCAIERRYGLGRERTLQHFEEMVGVCFATRSMRSFNILERGWRFADDDYSTLLTALSLTAASTATTVDVGKSSRVTDKVVAVTTAATCVPVGDMPSGETAKGNTAAETQVTMTMTRTISPMPGVRETKKIPHQPHGNALMALSIVQSYLSDTAR